MVRTSSNLLLANMILHESLFKFTWFIRLVTTESSYTITKKIHDSMCMPLPEGLS